MSGRLASFAALAAFASVLFLGGCRKQAPDESVAGERLAGRVSMETSASPSDNTDWATRVYAARFSTPILPVYPVKAIASAVERATVRVDFVIGTDGRAHQVRSEIQGSLAEPELAGVFEAACLAAAARWRFSPAWRLARNGEINNASIVPLESRAYLLFRFDLAVHRQGGPIEVSFGDGG